jgi:hypothetical protein
MTNKLIAECCDRAGEVYAAPIEAAAAKLTRDQAADIIIGLAAVAGPDRHHEALRMAEAALRAQGEPVLKVFRGEICYVSREDDQSFGMWCPVTPDYAPPYPDGAEFYAVPQSQGEEHGH